MEPAQRPGFSLTIKYDGSPSIVVGNDPADGKFFVATKGIFNKKPVVYKSHEDLKQISSEGLRKTMLILFEELSKEHFGMITQGDLMWLPEDLTWSGDRLRFRTNTLSYEIKYSWEIDLAKDSIGVAWHTSYFGQSLGSLKVADSLFLPLSKSKRSNLFNVSTYAYVKQHWVPTKDRLAEHEQRIDFIEMSTVSLPSDFPEKAQLLVKRFFAQNLDLKPSKFMPSLLSFVNEYYTAEFEKRKSPRGMSNVAIEEFRVTSWIENIRKELYTLYSAYKEIVALKHDLISYYDVSCRYQAYTPNGMPTGQEGYVIKQGEIITKLVNRPIFTEANRLNSLNIRR